MPLVSIIVPVYNLEKLVSRCAESVKAQTFQNWECILVDDGSTDESAARCRTFEKEDGRFSLVCQQNGGVSAARNTGMEKAKGEYILFLDGDDVLEPFALEWALARQKEHPGDLICWHLAAETDPHMDPQKPAEKKIFTAAQRQVFLCAGSGSNVTTKLFSKALIEEQGLRFPLGCHSGEDGIFCQQYVDAFFAGANPGKIQEYNAPIYIAYTDNGANRLSHRAPGAENPLSDPKENRGYAQKIMEEYKALIQSVGWESFAPKEALYFAIQYAKRFAFGVWVASQLKEELPQGFWGQEAVGGLLSAMKKYKLYNAYYWPLRLHWKWLIGKVYASDETGRKRLYWRVFLLGDLLLARRWNKL